MQSQQDTSEESVMRQRSEPEAAQREHERQDTPYVQVQPADSAATSASALQAVQDALDLRDNGGDVPAGDEE